MVEIRIAPDDPSQIGQPKTVKLKLKSADAKLTMHVKIYAPFHTYFDGEAHSISAINDTGPFDILPKHHNFLTLVSPCRVVVRNDEGEQHFDISRGIMHVKSNQVILFLDV